MTAAKLEMQTMCRRLNYPKIYVLKKNSTSLRNMSPAEEESISNVFLVLGRRNAAHLGWKAIPANARLIVAICEV